MTKEDLINATSFLNTESTKHLQVFVTTDDSDPTLLNIEEQFLPELCNQFMKSIYDYVNNQNPDFSLEQYSVSAKRDNAIYLFDLPKEDYLKEMKIMVSVTETIDFPLFSDILDKIIGLYGVIRDENHVLSFYKSISPIDKTYANKTYLLGKLIRDDQFVKLQNNLLRVSPQVLMFYIDDNVFLLEIQKLEKTLNLGAVLLKAARNHIQTIKNRDLIETDIYLEKACQRSCVCKKLIHAMTESQVVKKGLSNEDLLHFALDNKWKDVVKLSVNKSKTKFRVKNVPEAERFIKLMDDDYLTSELTTAQYDAQDKTETVT